MFYVHQPNLCVTVILKLFFIFIKYKICLFCHCNVVLIFIIDCCYDSLYKYDEFYDDGTAHLSQFILRTVAYTVGVCLKLNWNMLNIQSCWEKISWFILSWQKHPETCTTDSICNLSRKSSFDVWNIFFTSFNNNILKR